MSAIDVLIRNSFKQARQSSQVSLVLSESLKDHNERSWSWNYIQEQFEVKKSEELFHRYQARLQHVLFVLMLILNVVHNIAVSIASVIDIDQQGNLSQFSVQLGLRAASFAVFIVIFVLAYREEWFLPEWRRVSMACFVLLLMLLNAHSNTLYQYLENNCDAGIRPTYDIILVIYIMLPFPWKYQCVMAGLGVTFLELLFSGLCRHKNDNFSAELGADLMFYIVVGLVGLYMRFLMEIMNGRAFLDRRELIESSFTLQYEKTQEEQLLLTVLPQHITSQVRSDIRNVISNIYQRTAFPRRTFNELYIERHVNVSILYADIVNSMKLAASLNGSELVDTLNELFARFDESAERNSCMRIKLLGDCYNCVSGVPKYDPDHADNCVQMGLDMIRIIRTIRAERLVDVGMRIGIHTGNIMSGLIGSRKWQYDIWSKDVDIASHMEQAGRPGHVHITDVTYKNLHGKYNIRLCDSLRKDSFLQNTNLENTYLISPTKQIMALDRHSIESDGFTRFFGKAHRGSMASIPPVAKAQFRRWHSGGSEMINSRNLNRVPLDYSLRQFQLMIEHVNNSMDKEINRLSLSKKDQWCQQDINPVILTFTQSGLEKAYMEEADPLFKYYLLCVLVLLCGMAVIRALDANTPRCSVLCWVMYASMFVIVVMSVILAWFGYLWYKWKRKRDKQTLRYQRPWITKLSHQISKNIFLRLILWFFISAAMLSLANIDLVSFRNMTIRTCTNTTLLQLFSNLTLDDAVDDVGYHNTWYLTFNTALALTSTSVFLKINYLLKCVLNITGIAVYLYFLYDLDGIFNSRICLQFNDWRIFGIRSTNGQTYFLIMLFVLLHILDRQIEYVCRLDFLSKRKLSEEKEEAQMMGIVNRMLLFNILPAHVAERYLTRNVADFEELYYEGYDSVAVMFASIPNYTTFYSEEQVNEQGRRCLQVLNEIICDFDELLFMPMYYKIEKIKTIGSTYMAAAGLLPGRGSRDSNEIEEEPHRNTLLLVQFATNMMEKLPQMNKDTQQEFQLRIGIAIGPVIAGVVGAGKPQYDIWGDTVNTASRMESTGVIGRIQVTKEVANILQEDGRYQCESRGKIFVKGKGMLETFLVETKFDEPPQESTFL